MANKITFVLLAVALCTVSADPWASDPAPSPCAQELEPLPCGGPLGPTGPAHSGGLLNLGSLGVNGNLLPGGLAPGDLAPSAPSPPPTVRRLRTITIPGRRSHIIEHHSRPIWIRSAVTRFVVPSAPVVVKPVLIHRPAPVIVRPNVITQNSHQSVPAPILLRIVKQIEQPATQRTLIVERPNAQSSCRVEAATALGGIAGPGAIGGLGGLGGLGGCGCGGLGGLGGCGCGGLGGCGCGLPTCHG